MVNGVVQVSTHTHMQRRGFETVVLLFLYQFISFIFLSEENLRAALGKMGIGGHAMEDVLDKVRNRHYQVTGFLPCLALNLVQLIRFYFLCSTIFDILSLTWKFSAGMHLDFWSHSRLILWRYQPSKSILQGKPKNPSTKGMFYFTNWIFSKNLCAFSSHTKRLNLHSILSFTDNPNMNDSIAASVSS